MRVVTVRKALQGPFQLPSHGVNRNLWGELGHCSQAGRDTETLCLFRLKPDVPSHPADPDSPRATV